MKIERNNPDSLDLTIDNCNFIIWWMYDMGFRNKPIKVGTSLWDKLRSPLLHLKNLEKLGTGKSIEAKVLYRYLNEIQFNRLITTNEKDLIIIKSDLYLNKMFDYYEIKKLPDDITLNDIKHLEFSNNTMYHSDFFAKYLGEDCDNYRLKQIENELYYYDFLMLFICQISFNCADDILDYHYQIATDKDYFIRKIKTYSLEYTSKFHIPHLTEVISEWLENQNRKLEDENLKETKLNTPAKTNKPIITNKIQGLINYFNGIEVKYGKVPISLYNKYREAIDFSEPESKKIYEAKIDLLNSTILHLKGYPKTKAEKELEKYKNAYKDLF